MHGFRWTPGIGDPTFAGWLTVFAYFAAAWLCLRAFMAEKAGPPRPYVASVLALVRVLRKHGTSPPLPAQRAAIWLGLCAAMLLLGVNKQLDLQTLFTDLGRLIAHRGGFYEGRRGLQLLFILFMGACALVLLRWLFVAARGPLRDFRLPFFGVTLVTTFVIVRAASFHKFDELLGRPISGRWLNFLLEVSGIALIALAAYRRGKKS